MEKIEERKVRKMVERLTKSRLSYIIPLKTQLTFVILTTGLILIMAFFIGSIIYFLSMRLFLEETIGKKEWIQEILPLRPILYYQLKTIFSPSLIILLMSQGILIAALWLSIILRIGSHVPQLKTGLEAVAIGDYSQRLILKKKDYFYELAPIYNRMVESLEKERLKNFEAIDLMESGLKAVSEGLEKGDISKEEVVDIMGKLKISLQELREKFLKKGDIP